MSYNKFMLISIILGNIRLIWCPMVPWNTCLLMLTWHVERGRGPIWPRFLLELFKVKLTESSPGPTASSHLRVLGKDSPQGRDLPELKAEETHSRFLSLCLQDEFKSKDHQHVRKTSNVEEKYQMIKQKFVL